LKFTIPANLNLEELLLANPTIKVKRRKTINGKRPLAFVNVKSSTLIKHLPYCYYLIDLIITQYTQQHKVNNDFVNPNAKKHFSPVASYCRMAPPY